MKILIYFLQFIIIGFFFIIFKIIGYKNSSDFGALIGFLFGPIFRSKKIIYKNLKIAYPTISDKEIKSITNSMWKNYGRILSHYMFIKDFRKKNFNKYIEVEGKNILSEIKKSNKPVIFISGHFNNFELLAMTLELNGINLSVIYRPLNNIFLNKIMLKIRKNYICKNQIPKGVSGLKTSLNLFKKGYSIAMMIDQRVSQGIKVNLFNKPALTSTIPAQFIKKYNCLVVPVYIERKEKYNFKVKIDRPIKFENKYTTIQISQKLNDWLERKINTNPNQWIWTHNRWK